MSNQEDINKTLIQAVKDGDIARVREAVESGADASCITAAVIPPMEETAEHGEIMRYLFAHGTDVNHNEFEEGILLQFSASRRQFKYLQLYLDAGADINLASAVNGLTVIHLVKDLDMVKFLLDAGADVNRKCYDDAPTSDNDPARVYGETPLHFAAAYANQEVIELLLEAGADKTILSAKGETPLDYAKQRNRSEDIIQLLR